MPSIQYVCSCYSEKLSAASGIVVGLVFNEKKTGRKAMKALLAQALCVYVSSSGSFLL